MPRCPICARAPSTQACSCCFEARFFPQALWLILSVKGSAPALVRHAASRFNSVSRHVGTCCNPFAQRGVSRSPWLPALRRVSQTAAQHHGKERRTASREQDGRWKRETRIERHLRVIVSPPMARRLTVTPRHGLRESLRNLSHTCADLQCQTTHEAPGFAPAKYAFLACTHMLHSLSKYLR